MLKISLIIEKIDNGFLGRVNFDENLIVAEERSLDKVETKIRQLLKKYHGISTGASEFQYKYDLSSLFEAFNYLKISSIANIAGVNSSLLRQYVTGNKHASQVQAKKIEDAIRKI